VHPTDFSDLSGIALAHALRIALAGKSKLHLLHVEPHDTDVPMVFPHVRRLLVQWGLSEADDPPSVVASKLGIEVDTTLIRRQEPTQGIIGFLRENAFDLIVLATHGRDGLEYWRKGSVAEIVARHAAAPSLFIAPGARGFVSQISGDVQLRRALVPIDASPSPDMAITMTALIGRLLTGGELGLDLLHVGRSAPAVPAAASQRALPQVMLRQGHVAETIVDAAIEFEADVIGMATAGHRNILDMLRGSTTERVVRHAPCPVLAVPGKR